MINANTVSTELAVITLHDMKNVAQNYILLDLSQKKEVWRSEARKEETKVLQKMWYLRRETRTKRNDKNG